MGLIDDPNDHAAAIRDIVRRIRQLETASPLNHSSISHGTGIAVRIADGIHLEDTGSIAADGLKISRDDGGSVKVGTTEVKPGSVKAGTLEATGQAKVGTLEATGQVKGGSLLAGKTGITAAGDITNSDGELKFLVNVTGAAHLTFDGQVRGKQGVQAPYKGVMQSLGPALESVDTKAGNADLKAGNAATAAAGAKNRADDAYDLANAKLGLPTYTAMKNIINDLSSRLGDIDGGPKYLLPQNPTG